MVTSECLHPSKYRMQGRKNRDVFLLASAFISDIDIFAETPLHHTESAEKVKEALGNIFGPQGTLTVELDRVTYSSNDLESLRFMKEQFRDRRVRAAARRILLANSTGIETRLLLNKQAATAGIAAVCDDPSESALGPIILRLRGSPNVDRMVEWLTQGLFEGDEETEKPAAEKADTS